MKVKKEFLLTHEELAKAIGLYLLDCRHEQIPRNKDINTKHNIKKGVVSYTVEWESDSV